MNLDTAIEERRSTRKFTSKKVQWDKVLEAADAAIKAPIAGNNWTVKFIIIENEQLIADIADVSEQPWIAEASILVAVCSDDRALLNLYKDRGYMYARQQVGAAIQNFLLKTTDLGISSCWVGSFDEEGVRDRLQAPEYVTVDALIPLGFSAEKSSKKPRKVPLQSTLFWGKWGKKERPTRFTNPTTREHH